MSDAFGYSNDPRVADVYGIQVAEGKRKDTLEPVVVIYFRASEDEEQVGFAVPLDMAENLVGELQRWTVRAREKHWE